MNTVALIVALVLSSRNVPTTIVEGVVYVDGRPGCTAEAVGGDAWHPVIVCKASTKVGR